MNAPFRYTDVTQVELDQMAKHHRQTSYSENEASELYMLVKKYVNQHQTSCVTCSSELRDAKDAMNQYYLFYKDKIETNLKAQEPINTIEITTIASNSPDIKLKGSTTVRTKCKCRNKKNCKCKTK